MNDEREPVPGVNIRPLIAIAAVPSVLVGLLLLAFSGREPVLLLYGVAITLLGLVMLGIWIRAAVRGDRSLRQDGPSNRWFPILLFTIVALQAIYLLVRRFC